MPGPGAYTTELKDKKKGRKSTKDLDRNGRAPGHPAYEGPVKGKKPSNGDPDWTDPKAVERWLTSRGGPSPEAVRRANIQPADKGKVMVDFGQMFRDAMPKPKAKSGGFMGLSGSMVDKIKAGLAGGGGTSVADLVSQIAGSIPQAPMVNPALVDVEATLKPFAAAREATQQQADQNRVRLDELARSGQADVQRVNAATQDRLAALEAMRRQVAAQDAAAAKGATQAGMADLQAQGVDPSILAGAQAQQQALTNEAAHAGDAMLGMVADAKAQAEIEAARRQADMADGTRNAKAGLDTNLLQAMIGLQSQEANARSEAERYNAQAMQEAAQQNAAAQSAAWEQQTQLFPAVMQSAQDMGGFGFPERDAVLRQLTGGPASGLPSSVEQTLLLALQGADNPEDALANALTGIDTLNSGREDAGQTTYSPNMPAIRNLIQRYYGQDTTRVNPNVARTVAQMFGVQLPLRGAGSGRLTGAAPSWMRGGPPSGLL